LHADNFAGVHGLLLNPANAAATPTGFELNLLSAYASVSTDYARIDGRQAQDAIGDEDYGSALGNRSLSDGNQFFGEVDVLGPSVLIGLGKRSGLGILTRVRSSYSTQGLNGGLLEGTYHTFGSLTDFNFSATDHRSTLHAWGEVAVTFGTTLIDREKTVLKIGASYKMLRGIGAVYTYGDRLVGNYASREDRVSVAGDMTFGRTPGFYFTDLDVDRGNLATGSGLDAGLVFLWRPTPARNRRALHRPYRLKVAASVVDLGSITYGGAEETDYTLAGSLPAEDIEDAEAVEDVLIDNFPGTDRRTDAQVSLPTALHLLVDVRVVGKLYTSATFSSPLLPAKSAISTRIPRAVTLSPRLETKTLSLHLPVTLRQGQGALIGTGVRLGMLTVGSGSVISHFIGNGGNGVDVFAAVKLPFPRRQLERVEKE
jgi:hypothetical protein